MEQAERPPVQLRTRLPWCGGGVVRERVAGRRVVRTDVVAVSGCAE
jgi:hypothetical protein